MPRVTVTFIVDELPVGMVEVADDALVHGPSTFIDVGRTIGPDMSGPGVACR
jgi:hypothetical protein